MEYQGSLLTLPNPFSVAFSRKGELQMALNALEQAARLEPDNPDFAKAVVSVKDVLAASANQVASIS